MKTFLINFSLMLPGCALFAHGFVFGCGTTIALGIFLFLIPWFISAVCYTEIKYDQVDHITKEQIKYENEYGLIEDNDIKK